MVPPISDTGALVPGDSGLPRNRQRRTGSPVVVPPVALDKPSSQEKATAHLWKMTRGLAMAATVGDQKQIDEFTEELYWIAQYSDHKSVRKAAARTAALIHSKRLGLEPSVAL